MQRCSCGIPGDMSNATGGEPQSNAVRTGLVPNAGLESRFQAAPHFDEIQNWAHTKLIRSGQRQRRFSTRVLDWKIG